jgi:replicative DNA helicase
MDDTMVSPVTTDPDAERSVLGAMMLRSSVVFEVIEILKPGDFNDHRNEAVFTAIRHLADKDMPTDALAVVDELLRSGELRGTLDASYVHSLTDSVVVASNAGYHAEIVHRNAMRRQVREIAAQIAETAADGRVDPVDAIEDARQKLDQLGAAGHVSLAPIGEFFYDYSENLTAKPRYVPTPWWDMNRIVGGYREGSLIVVAARPSQGKSNIALQSAMRLALDGPVAFVSLEMPRDEIMSRMIAQQGQVLLQSLTNHELNNAAWQGIAQVQQQVKSLPLYIATMDEVATITQVRAFARSVAQKTGKPLAGVVVDYLQLLTSGERVENRQVEVSNFTRSLKLLAQQLHCPVIALSQLNRGSAQRKDPRPVITDLRESGSIEQDADTVWLLHRDEKQRPNDLEIQVAKNRHGQNGRVTLRWEGMFARALSREWSPTAMFGEGSDQR